MDLTNLPRPQPDFERFRGLLLRQREPERVHFVELSHDPEIVESIVSQLPGDDGADERERPWRRLLRFWHQLGYDYLTVGATLDMPLPWIMSADTAALARPARRWMGEASGPIQTREDFEHYPWADPEHPADLSGFEIVAKHLPEGMKIIGATCGVFEYSVWTMGYASFALALKDQPDLVADIFQQVGSLLVKVYEQLAAMEAVGALWLCDDMGFKHATMISPEDLRKYVFPWQKKIGEVVHAAGKPFLLHACGNLIEVMDDLIDYVGIDAKHSFEDIIMPVKEAKRRWGNRIAILGGVDMDFLSRAGPEEVRRYVHRTLQECMPGGGYALGSGNTVANYIPVENFLVMLDEGRRYGA